VLQAEPSYGMLLAAWVAALAGLRLAGLAKAALAVLDGGGLAYGVGSDGAYGSGWRLRLGSEALCGGCSEAEPESVFFLIEQRLRRESCKKNSPEVGSTVKCGLTA